MADNIQFQQKMARALQVQYETEKWPPLQRNHQIIIHDTRIRPQSNRKTSDIPAERPGSVQRTRRHLQDNEVKLEEAHRKFQIRKIKKESKLTLQTLLFKAKDPKNSKAPCFYKNSSSQASYNMQKPIRHPLSTRKELNGSTDPYQSGYSLRFEHALSIPSKVSKLDMYPIVLLERLVLEQDFQREIKDPMQGKIDFLYQLGLVKVEEEPPLDVEVIDGFAFYSFGSEWDLNSFIRNQKKDRMLAVRAEDSGGSYRLRNRRVSKKAGYKPKKKRTADQVSCKSGIASSSIEDNTEESICNSEEEVRLVQSSQENIDQSVCPPEAFLSGIASTSIVDHIEERPFESKEVQSSWEDTDQSVCNVTETLPDVDVYSKDFARYTVIPVKRCTNNTDCNVLVLEEEGTVNESLAEFAVSIIQLPKDVVVPSGLQDVQFESISAISSNVVSSESCGKRQRMISLSSEPFDNSICQSTLNLKNLLKRQRIGKEIVQRTMNTGIIQRNMTAIGMSIDVIQTCAAVVPENIKSPIAIQTLEVSSSENASVPKEFAQSIDDFLQSNGKASHHLYPDHLIQQCTQTGCGDVVENCSYQCVDCSKTSIEEIGKRAASAEEDVSKNVAEKEKQSPEHTFQNIFEKFAKLYSKS